jgi:hypothetical protein
MSLLEVFDWLESSPLLVAMRGSSWLFPVIACIHLLGLAVLGGAVLVVDLRLLGLGLTQQPVAAIAGGAQRLMWVALGVMVPSGVLLFMCFATKYYYLTAFWLKLGALVAVLVLTLSARRVVLAGEPNTHSPPVKLVALSSIALWLTVAVSGRLIGFP